MCSLPVDRREVDRLGAAAHLGCHLIERDIEDDRRSLPVDVATGLKCVDERGIQGQVGKQAKLDLRVVRREKGPASLRDEAAADITAELTPDRDVLEVGVTR